MTKFLVFLPLKTIVMKIMGPYKKRIEIKLGGPDLIEKGADTLKRLSTKINT
jgi:hypothetical protein